MKSKFFNMYFNEEGEEMQDPNMENNGAAQQQSSPMLDIEDTDSKTDKEFPEEKDGTTPEQDLLNFTNYQKLQYFKKFTQLLQLIKATKITFNNSKNYINFDELNDEQQHKHINLCITSLEEIESQVNFFLEKGIASVNIDKTRVIFNAMIKKMNLIIDTFEETIKKIELNVEENK